MKNAKRNPGSTASPDATLRATLDELQRTPRGSPAFHVTLAEVLLRLHALSPSRVARRAQSIAAALRPQWSSPGFFAADAFTALIREMKACPGLEYLYLFHPSGYVREAALGQIVGPLPSPFIYAAICWRLNDWVWGVRIAAKHCAQRCFPLTPPQITIAAHAALYVTSERWARWGGDERLLFEEGLSKPELKCALVDLLATSRQPYVVRAFRLALRRPVLDGELEALARSARHPDIRARALQALIARAVRWRTDSAWRWENKTYGYRRRVPVLTSRAIEHSVSLPELIRHCVADSSALVRRYAVEGLIDHRHEMPDAGALATKLAADDSGMVRWRADFVLRHLAD